jgi:hypothetical protein
MVPPAINMLSLKDLFAMKTACTAYADATKCAVSPAAEMCGWKRSETAVDNGGEVKAAECVARGAYHLALGAKFSAMSSSCAVVRDAASCKSTAGGKCSWDNQRGCTFTFVTIMPGFDKTVTLEQLTRIAGECFLLGGEPDKCTDNVNCKFDAAKKECSLSGAANTPGMMFDYLAAAPRTMCTTYGGDTARCVANDLCTPGPDNTCVWNVVKAMAVSLYKDNLDDKVSASVQAMVGCSGLGAEKCTVYRPARIGAATTQCRFNGNDCVGPRWAELIFNGIVNTQTRVCAERHSAAAACGKDAQCAWETPAGKCVTDYASRLPQMLADFPVSKMADFYLHCVTQDVGSCATASKHGYSCGVQGGKCGVTDSILALRWQQQYAEVVGHCASVSFGEPAADCAKLAGCEHKYIKEVGRAVCAPKTLSGCPVDTGGVACGGNGICGDAGCRCFPGYEGAACGTSKQECPKDECPKGVCVGLTPLPSCALTGRLACSGCDLGCTVKAGKYNRICDGIQYFFSVPAKCAGAPVATGDGGCDIIMNIPGYSLTAGQQESASNMNKVGNDAGFVVITPSENVPGEGGLFDLPNWKPDSDHALLQAMLRRARTHFRSTNVHVAGFSQGGFATWRLLCDASDIVCSAAPLSAAGLENWGPGYGSTCFSGVGRGPATPRSILYQSGTKDKMAPIANFRTQVDNVRRAYGLASTPSSKVLSGQRYDWLRYKKDGVIFETTKFQYGSGLLQDNGHCFPMKTNTHLHTCASFFGSRAQWNWGEEVVNFFTANKCSATAVSPPVPAAPAAVCAPRPAQTPTPCTGNGVCKPNGKCVCTIGASGTVNTGPACNITQLTPASCPAVSGRVCSFPNGVCSNDKCVCSGGFTGAACADFPTCPKDATGKVCSGAARGTCHSSNLRCQCLPGFKGAACEGQVTCPPCAGLGTGHGGTCSADTQFQCKCEDQYYGDDCSKKQTCAAGFHRLCTQDKVCVSTCENGGMCNKRSGTCVCPFGFGGTNCKPLKAECAKGMGGLECSGHGVCGAGTCSCLAGFINGLLGACEVQKRCPSSAIGGQQLECSGAGACDPRSFTCACDEGRSGANCALVKAKCPNDAAGKECSNVGGCLVAAGLAKCVCPPGRSGAACQIKATCPVVGGKVCNGAGTCSPLTNLCRCDGKAYGADCSKTRTCPKARADLGSVYVLDEVAADATPCSGRGKCNSEELVFAGKVFTRLSCACHRGFTGAACQNEVLPCPVDSLGRVCGGTMERGQEAFSASGGKCDASSGKCYCARGRTGAACDVGPVVLACPTGSGGQCNGNGVCASYVQPPRTLGGTYTKIQYCVCTGGTSGRVCEHTPRSCPATSRGPCNASGKCNPFSGKCTCTDAFEGDACALAVTSKPCPVDANAKVCGGDASRGACDGTVGVCRCVRPYFGAACEKELAACPMTTKSIGGVDFALECSGNGFCNRPDLKSANATATCVCKPGVTGSACDQRQTCASKCANGGSCNQRSGKCMCRYGFSGADCGTACPKDETTGAVCSGRGRCQADGACSCLFGFSGAACTAAPCPMDKDGNVCSNKGACRYSALTGAPYCECNASPKRFGYACQYSAASVATKSAELRDRVTASLAQAQELVAEEQRCLDEEKPFLCPDADAVANAKKNTCQASRKDCEDAGKKAACRADATKRWCGVSCIDKALRCPRSRACKGGKVRCADGSCAGRADKCADASSLCDVAGEVPCGDGVTCAADEAACRAAVQLDGCPVGLFACPSNPKECRASKKDCHCAAADGQNAFCGWARDAQGRLERALKVDGETGDARLRKVPVCMPSGQCAAGIPLTADIAPTSTAASADTDVVAALETAGAAALGAIRIPRGAVTSAGGDGAESVSFAVAPIAQADMSGGSFSKIERMTVALSIVPDRVVSIDLAAGGIEIDLCVAQDGAQSNATLCGEVLKRLRPFSSNDVTADDAAEVAGGCAKGDSCGCSCKFTTPHLTAFTVADTEFAVAGEVSADEQIAVILGNVATAPTPAPAAAVGSDNDLPVIPIIGTIAGVAAVFAAILVKARSGAMQHVSARGPTMDEAYPKTRANSNPIHVLHDAEKAGADMEESSII